MDGINFSLIPVNIPFLYSVLSRGQDIHTILTRVNEEVSRKEANVRHNGEVCLAKQIPEPKYTLRRKLVFRVPK